MTYEPFNIPREPVVLAHAGASKSVEWLRPPLWLRCSVVVVALFIIVMFSLGLVPLSGGVDYTRIIPLSEIIEYAWASGVTGTLNNASMVCMAAFAPIAAAGLLAFLLIRGTVPLRVVIAINVGLPAIWLSLFWPIFVVIGPPILVAAVCGGCDGEAWSEGFICYAAMASWTTLWLATTLVLAVVGALKTSAVRQVA